MSRKKTDAFLRATVKVQNQFTLQAISRMWNSTGLGRHAKQTTVRRWLNRGPNSKNGNFEIWVVGLASSFS